MSVAPQSEAEAIAAAMRREGKNRFRIMIVFQMVKWQMREIAACIFG